MKILVVGSGGREHALVWRLARAGHQLVCAPGNPGIARDAECLPIAVDAIDGLVTAAADRGVDLIVVGPEAPLVAGLADRARDRGIAVFGPGADGARLEGSKAFSKRFFRDCGIRTAEFFECSTVAEADEAIDRIGALGDGVVVKADGLAAGKGVTVCDTADEARAAARACLEGGAFGDAGRRVVIEQRLRGRELSLMAITDGHRYVLLEQAEDHKAALDGDRGPNTGGMGAVSPAGWATPELLDRARRDIFDPTLAGLRAAGIDYRGVLYAGLMVDAGGVPWILEYNCRFGDPETQPLMLRLRSDLGQWLYGAATGALPAGDLAWDPRAAVCVILASRGYPQSSEAGVPITGADAFVDDEDVVVFHAGTRERDGRLETAGGRVLGVTALGADVAAARARAYSAVDRIRFDGMHFRRDIGARGASPGRPA
ncbi:MAG: phosphoribosylamine--glycine ligase [Deltaproteobacteria bacterium]|nr:MAG: phosphoribosylamine--glycine ligase [Deltaproteobacteria bacterium]